jgi:hypothetical protein
VRELRSTIEPDKTSAKDFEVNDDFFTLFIPGRICGSNPVIFQVAVGKYAGVESRGFARITVEPKTCD